jgi:hypothetical protein
VYPKLRAFNKKYHRVSVDLRGNMEQEWKSPRKIEEEVKQYRSKRFEDYMVMADEGKLTRALAITALREEIQHSEEATDVLRGIGITG